MNLPQEPQNLILSIYFSGFCQGQCRLSSRPVDPTQLSSVVGSIRPTYRRTWRGMLHLSMVSGICVSANTIRDWTHILERSFHILVVPPWYRSYSKRLVKTPKIYFLDSGLHAYLTGWENPETALKGPLAGPMLENWVVGLLVRSFWHRGFDKHLHFWRTTTGQEIDIWSENEGKITAAEIKLASSGLHRYLNKTFAPLKSIDPHPSVFGNRFFLCLGDSVTPIAENTWQVPVQYID